MKSRFALIVFFVALFGAKVLASDETPNSPSTKLPVLVGDTKIVRAFSAYRTAIVMDGHGTVYVLSVTGSSQTSLFRISHKGAAKELILYRGWPYILDKKGRFMTLDPSWMPLLNKKIPYVSMRFVKTAPLAVGAGVASYALGLIDSTFLNIVTGPDFHGGTALLGGILAFYGVDIGYTMFFRSQRSIGTGGNYFTNLVASGVSSVVEDEDYDDYVIETRDWHDWRKHVTKQHLSFLVPASLGGTTCMEYLTKLSLK